MSNTTKVNTKCQHEKNTIKGDKVNFCKLCGVLMTGNVIIILNSYNLNNNNNISIIGYLH